MSHNIAKKKKKNYDQPFTDNLSEQGPKLCKFQLAKQPVTNGVHYKSH